MLSHPCSNCVLKRVAIQALHLALVFTKSLCNRAVPAGFGLLPGLHARGMLGRAGRQLQEEVCCIQMVCVPPCPCQQWVKATPEIQVTYLSPLSSAATESKHCSLWMGRTSVCRQRGLQGRRSREPRLLRAARLFSVQLSLCE